jgi:hypothetical protein
LEKYREKNEKEYLVEEMKDVRWKNFSPSKKRK